MLERALEFWTGMLIYPIMANLKGRRIIRYTEEALEVNDLGPAMRSLNDRQRSFVMALFDLGDHPSNADAARAAGYKGDGNAMRVTGHRLMHSESIQAAIKEEADRRQTMMLPLAQKRLQSLVLDPQAKDHFPAIKHAQALSGQSPKQIHVVEHVADRKAIIADIKGALAMMRELGISVSEKLVPIDTDFEELEYAGSTEGLEDIL